MRGLPRFWMLVLVMAQPVQQTVHADAVGPPATGPSAPCYNPREEHEALIDRVHRGMYGKVCGASLWFDSLFGNPRFDQDSDETYGRIGISEDYDRVDGSDPSFRFRARFALPNMKNRLRVTLNRDDVRRSENDRPDNPENPLPDKFRRVDDDAWLLGLGYSRQSGLENGFDFGVGIRIRAPVDPFVKGTYRHNLLFGDDTALRFRETPFWQKSRGYGAITQVTLDHLLRPTLLLRWNNEATVAQDTEGVLWGTSASAYQDLRGRSAVSISTFLRGETGAEVAIQNYGVETRYRRQIFREWLFLALSANVTWPRYTVEDKRMTNPGAGVGFEMYFGPVPDRQMR